MLTALILICSLATAAPTLPTAHEITLSTSSMSLPHSPLQPTASCMGRLTWPAVRWGAISPATKPSRWSACAVRPTGSTKRKAVADDALPRNDDESFPGTLGSHAFHHAAGLSALGLVPTATAKAGRASIAACQRVSSG